MYFWDLRTMMWPWQWVSPYIVMFHPMMSPVRYDIELIIMLVVFGFSQGTSKWTNAVQSIRIIRIEIILQGNRLNSIVFCEVFKSAKVILFLTGIFLFVYLCYWFEVTLSDYLNITWFGIKAINNKQK